MLLGLLYMEGSEKNKNRLDLAKLLLDEAKKRNDKYAPLHNAYGLLELQAATTWPRRSTQFQQAVELDPNFVEARMNVGNIVLGFRKYDEAAEQFSEVLKHAAEELRRDRRARHRAARPQAARRGRGELQEGGRPGRSARRGLLQPRRALQGLPRQRDQDLKRGPGAYRTAIQYFQQSASKPNADPDMQAEARENITDCEKNIKSLDEAIRFQQQPRRRRRPAPSAGGGEVAAHVGAVESRPVRAKWLE